MKTTLTSTTVVVLEAHGYNKKKGAMPVISIVIVDSDIPGMVTVPEIGTFQGMVSVLYIVLVILIVW